MIIKIEISTFRPSKVFSYSSTSLNFIWERKRGEGQHHTCLTTLLFFFIFPSHFFSPACRLLPEILEKVASRFIKVFAFSKSIFSFWHKSLKKREKKMGKETKYGRTYAERFQYLRSRLLDNTVLQHTLI